MTKGKSTKKEVAESVEIKVIQEYYDLQLNKTIKAGETLTVERNRGEYLEGLGLAKVLDDANGVK